ncbi:hypothetical protein BU24DRAFT_425199 [Aaosphaeria arxii CBS 175.79]|uniref:Uncharacterized protein n=1 Tax=Aaosphaeria arxii CBS 175.79 TaxID=1450172 RepID=A0A6A5XH76_9PLEO|nr:uncharacterized protein BU24DRAFT_425199 [Aaosphaeria arxii CBS 175.79]KAF2012558.1 hypothetical protein BU24DRAFT_425199 [Aaosphaeria arxii CBS 175.79]
MKSRKRKRGETPESDGKRPAKKTQVVPSDDEGEEVEEEAGVEAGEDVEKEDAEDVEEEESSDVESVFERIAPIKAGDSIKHSSSSSPPVAAPRSKKRERSATPEKHSSASPDAKPPSKRIRKSSPKGEVYMTLKPIM